MDGDRGKGGVWNNINTQYVNVMHKRSVHLIVILFITKYFIIILISKNTKTLNKQTHIYKWFMFD